MRGSQKANLIVFLIVAVAAFCISSTFATYTIHDDYDSYKLKALNNDTFEPKDIDYVPTYIPKNTTNTTTNSTTTENVTDEVEDTIDWNFTDLDWNDDDEEYEEG